MIFIDEIENIARSRDDDSTGMVANSVNMLLQMMDGFIKKENVVVVGATNYPWDLDSAVLRRFSNQIHFDLPTVPAIKGIIRSRIATYCRSVLEYIPEKESDNDALSSIGKKQCDSKFRGRDNRQNKKRDWICKSECRRQEKRDFTYYRDNFFTKFTDDDLDEIARKMHGQRFSSSDVDRLMNTVFQLMGSMARKLGTFTPYRYDNNLLYLSPYNNSFAKIPDKMIKDADAKDITISTQVINPILIMRQGDEIKRYINIFALQVNNKRLNNIITKIIANSLGSSLSLFSFYVRENNGNIDFNNMILRYTVTKGDESAVVYTITDSKRIEKMIQTQQQNVFGRFWTNMTNYNYNNPLHENIIALSNFYISDHNDDLYYVTQPAEPGFGGISKYIRDYHPYVDQNNIIDYDTNKSLIGSFIKIVNPSSQNEQRKISNISFTLSNDIPEDMKEKGLIRMQETKDSPDIKDKYDRLATISFDKWPFEMALSDSKSNIVRITSTINKEEFDRMNKYASNPAAFKK